MSAENELVTVLTHVPVKLFAWSQESRVENFETPLGLTAAMPLASSVMAL